MCKTKKAVIIQEVKHIPTKNVKKYTWKIQWLNVFFIGLLHIITFFSYIYLRPSLNWKTKLFGTSYRVIGMIGITAGCHRLWSHRAYKASTFAQILLMIMSSLNYVNSIYVWTRDHRAHHRYTDTDADPHNSKRGIFFSHVGWLLIKKHHDLKAAHIDMSDLERNPVVMFQYQYYTYIVTFLCFIFPTTVPMYFFGEDFWATFLGNTLFSYTIALNHIWFINSLNHAIGNKPYSRFTRAVENMYTMCVCLGEGFHNYHHTFPWDYSASHLKFDFRNITTIFINLLAKFGLVYELRQVPESMIDRVIKEDGDGSRISKPGNKTYLGIKESYLFHVFYLSMFLFYYVVVMP